MTIDKWLALGQTAMELGLVNALTVLSLFLSYSMLNVCDLSTDGCFTLGAAVGALVAIAGYPWLSLPAAMLAGMISGFVTATLQTRMGVQSLLAGIVVNTGLYSVNMALTGNRATLAMNKTTTVFSMAKDLLKGTPLAGQSTLLVMLIVAALVVTFLCFFLKTKLGLAIRATGSNADMVRSSSINPTFTTTVGLCVSNAFTGLSGCDPLPDRLRPGTAVQYAGVYAETGLFRHRRAGDLRPLSAQAAAADAPPVESRPGRGTEGCLN